MTTPRPSDRVLRAFMAIVRASRIAAGMTSADFAKLTGFHRSEIKRIEREAHSPTLATIERIAKPLGMTMTDFVGHIEELSRDQAGLKALERNNAEAFTRNGRLRT